MINTNHKSTRVIFATSIVVLLFIPSLILIESLHYIKLRDKNWYMSGYDPSYAYLYNSLNIARFKIPGHYDHPGTPMQIYGAAVLQTAWMINPYGGNNLTEAVIQQPEYYLSILNSSVAVLGAIALFAAGLVVFILTGNLWFGLLIQATPYISNLILYNAFLRITQENVLMISSLAMAVYTLHWYFSTEKNKVQNFSKGFGIISGIGIASKVIFFPLMIIPLIVLDGNRDRIRYLKITVITFIISTIPIILRYPNMGWWLVKLFFYSGMYGTGKIQVLEPVNYISALQGLFLGEYLYSKAYLILTIILVIAILILKLKGKSLKVPELKVLVAIFLVQSAGFLITAKHPKLAYLLPYECITGAAFIIIIHNFRTILKSTFLLKLIIPSLSLILILITINYGRLTFKRLFKSDDNYKYEKTWQTAINSSRGGALIGINPGPTPIAATFFANAYSSDRYAGLLSRIYPHYYIFDTYRNRLVNWNYDTLTIESLAVKYSSKIVIMGEDVDQLIDSLNVSSEFNFTKIPTEKAEIAILNNGTGIRK